jgi:hypothetical protein
MEHLARRALLEDIPLDGIGAGDRFATAGILLIAISGDGKSDARAIGAVIADAENIMIRRGRSVTRA